MKAKEIDVDSVRNVLDYNPLTGLFKWKKSRQGVKIDLSAGYKMKNGYLGISIDNRDYYAHRLAWAYVNGDIPDGQCVDHINGSRTDNRISNLRIGTQGQNMQNQKVAHSKNKSTGVLGAYFVKGKGKFKSTICTNGKTKHLGYFATVEEASAAYLSAKRQVHEFGEL